MLWTDCRYVFPLHLSLCAPDSLVLEQQAIGATDVLVVGLTNCRV
jgi:hypothetical protein